MEIKAILNGVLIFDRALRFFNVIRAFNMETTSNMLQLVEAALSAAALVSLESAVLSRYTTVTCTARETLL